MIFRLYNLLRRLNGYKFPRLGKWGHRLLYYPFRKPGVDLELLPGIRTTLDLTEPLSDSVYYYGTRYEYPTGDILLDWCREEPCTFFDIGANLGFFSLLVQSRVPHARGFAFEPNPKTFARLQRTIERNGLTRLKAIQKGVSDADGKLMFYGSEVNTGTNTFLANSEEARIPVGEVELTSFESFLQAEGLADLPPLSAVAKVDAEGFDVRVLRGMVPALKRKLFRGIAVEVNAGHLAKDGVTPADLYRIMEENGYVEIPAASLCSGKYPLESENVFFVPR